MPKGDLGLRSKGFMEPFLTPWDTSNIGVIRGVNLLRERCGKCCLFVLCHMVGLEAWLASWYGSAVKRHALLSNVKRSATDILNRLVIRSKVSNEGAFLPRSIRLKKS